MKKYKLFQTFTPLYYWTRNSKKKKIVHQGGTNSSKTWSLCQVIATNAVEDPESVTTVVANTSNTLERGALRDFKKLIKSSKILKMSIIDPNLVKGPFRFKNGSIVEFVSLSDEDNAKHGKREYLYLNEANSISYQAAKALMLRTSKKIYIDFNSDASFWVHEELIHKPDCDYFISNYTHNEHCPQSVIDELLHYKAEYLRTGSHYWKNQYRVYTLGKTGTTEGAVFDTVDYVNLLPLGLDKKGYGLDFGFTNDPTALVKCGRKGKKIYGKELIYQTGLTTPELIERFKKLGIGPRDIIIADNSNPDAITQIRKAGFRIFKVVKPKVIPSIDALKSNDIVLTTSSTHWRKEQQNYKYVKENDKYINEVEDEHNHCWDAFRYWYSYFHKIDNTAKGRGKRTASAHNK